MNFVILLLYRWLVVPLALMLMPLLAAFNPKLRGYLRDRWPVNGQAPWARLPRGRRPIWFHCASGEFEYAKPVITRLKSERPDLPILVTYFSPSYKKQVESFPGVDLFCPLPWDLAGPVTSFLDHVDPSLLLIARTDLWPELLHRCARRNLPMVLFSARRTRWRTVDKILWPVWRWLYGHLKVVDCVSEADAAQYRELLKGLPTEVRVSGDTRYDQVIARLAAPKAIREELFLAEVEPPILIAGSTWPEDEAALLKGLAPLVRQQELRLCIVPHEPSDAHIRDLGARLVAEELPYIVYSHGSSTNSWPVLVVDKVGILADLYRYGQIAFVGGSFRGSVHSVMEPLACGKVTWVGPFHENNREALEFKEVAVTESTRAVTAVASPQEWQERILKYLSEADFVKNGEQIRSQVQARTGASQKVATAALESLTPLRL